MINNILQQNDCLCVGCFSCELACPRHCIEMVRNFEGFFYPKVDVSKCINCGICLKHCPINFNKSLNGFSRSSFAIYLKNSDILLQSSSGGAFVGLAEKILQDNGVVFGAAYDNQLQVRQIAVTNSKDLFSLKGSKYIVSNPGDSFLQAKQYLEQHKKVLYTGTPCQIAGLYAFLGQEYENLFTVDLICHGTPSQKLFNKYINWLEKKFHGKIIYYGFRDKDIGGWNCGNKVKLKILKKAKIKTKILDAFSDPYYSSFLKFDTYRESCYTCKFATINRVGDLTIGDYFEGKHLYPQLKDINGVSLCIINTNKGKTLFETVKEKYFITPVLEKNYVTVKGNLIKPSPRGSRRDYIYDKIDELADKQYFKLFRETSIFNKLLYNFSKFAKKLIPEKIKQIIKQKLRNNHA